MNSLTGIAGNKYFITVKPQNKRGKLPAVILYHMIPCRSIHIYIECDLFFFPTCSRNKTLDQNKCGFTFAFDRSPSPAKTGSNWTPVAVQRPSPTWRLRAKSAPFCRINDFTLKICTAEN